MGHFDMYNCTQRPRWHSSYNKQTITENNLFLERLTPWHFMWPLANIVNTDIRLYNSKSPWCRIMSFFIHSKCIFHTVHTFLFCFGGHLHLSPRITPRGSGDHKGVLEIESGSTMSKASTLLALSPAPRVHTSDTKFIWSNSGFHFPCIKNRLKHQ